PPTAAADGRPHRGAVRRTDDHPSVLDGVRMFLQDVGFKVLTSDPGSKGLDLLLRHAGRDIRVVLLYYSMPDFNGEQTLQHIRKLSPGAKVIALTGFDAGQLPAGYRTGVDKVMQKPFTSGELVEALTN